MSELADREISALHDALDDEYQAWATYDQVIADFGDVSYLFERDEFGDLVGDVTSGVHVDVLLQTGNFFLVDPAPAAAQFVPGGQAPSGEQKPIPA